MRPCQLTISAFGPYADVCSIDMEKLGTQGIYLITGDTGAGKTTIFDAISFALFGEASGMNREAGMLRSKYAEANTPTQVYLQFEHAGRLYEITRNPEYYRPAKRGDGMTKEAASAELLTEGKTPVSGVNEVKKAVEELLGMNKDQFSKIVMLAQGDFQRLLLADTKQRQEIFRKLFKTVPYQQFQMALEKSRSEAYGKCCDAKKSVEQYIAGILCSSESSFASRVEEAKEGKLMTADTLLLLESMLAAEKLEKQNLTKTVTDIEKSLQELDEKIGKAREIEKVKEEREKSVVLLAEEKEKQKDFQIKVEEAKKTLADHNSLPEKAARIRAFLPQYTVLEQLETDRQKVQFALEKMQTSLSNGKNAEEELTIFIKALKEEYEETLHADVEKEKLMHRKEEISRQENQVKDLLTQYWKLQQQKEQLTSAQENYKNNAEEYQRLKHKADALEKAYLDGQAGILATHLEENKPCPVCGSLSHPNPAVCIESVPTKEELEDTKRVVENAFTKMNASSELAGQIKAGVDVLTEECGKSADKLFEKWTEEGLELAIQERNGSLQREKQEVELNLEEAEHKAQRNKALEKQIPEKEDQLGKITAQMQKAKEAIAENNARLESLVKQKAEIQNSLEYDSLQVAKKECESLENRYAFMQQELQKAEKRLQEHVVNISTLQGKIEGYEKTLSEQTQISLDEENSKREELLHDKEAVSQNLQAVITRESTNQTILQNVKKESANLEQLEKRLQWVAALANTANGKLTGSKDKIMLETFIQMTYFDRIIERANLRFMRMSGAQYELKRLMQGENAKSQGGLDLEVVDHYNGSHRSVKTLSGGESFMASLSLAMGLSEEIQAMAGGIQIDTLFVDEGFGSLDQDTLEVAFKALTSLTEENRLIGIISHVGSLKEKIDRQIVVKKGKSGGSSVELQV